MIDFLEKQLMRRISSDQWIECRDRLNNLPPIWRMGNGIHIVTGYREACDVLANKKISSEFIRRLSDEALRFGRIDRVNRIIKNSFALRDGVEHLFLRELVAPIFLPKQLQTIFGKTEEDAKNLIDGALEEADSIDIVEVLARRLPILVNCQILGLPYSKKYELRLMIDALVAEIEFDPINRNETELLNLIDLIDSFKSKPVPSWLDPLVTALHQNRISELDFEATILLLMISGYGTATVGIGSSALNLFAQDQAFSKLKNGTYQTENFIYESLRLNPPVTLLSRSAAENLEIGDHAIPKNELILIHMGAACRDPNIFEDPHDFNPHRTNKAQLIFGGGAHFCLGRLIGLHQIEASLRALLNYPLLIQAPIQNIAFHPYKIIQGPLSLPVKIDAQTMLT